jgi:hypothetical protein
MFINFSNQENSIPIQYLLKLNLTTIFRINLTIQIKLDSLNKLMCLIRIKFYYYKKQ